ncbi:hypothetical protein [Desulfosarcina ovata]|uniref:Uncharacterized protein n=1 Tax=Desulfosarcina ovata subsp. ovata TaxID=2752305 RepID=A0A5K8A3Z0_9BACT|nr:hypothetical protein [Desulfosarcina ovata]BBO87146.1 hypothetical protein DSCOOX_03260 [Desulfosarcina ovata subsp. ovata]
MKYGDVYYSQIYYLGAECFAKHSYRFRMEPVPGFKNFNRCGHVCRRMKTTYERRWNHAHSDYVRPTRRHLPHVWDDIWVNRDDRSWKRATKRRCQWDR